MNAGYLGSSYGRRNVSEVRRSRLLLAVGKNHLVGAFVLIEVHEILKLLVCIVSIVLHFTIQDLGEG